MTDQERKQRIEVLADWLDAHWEPDHFTAEDGGAMLLDGPAADILAEAERRGAVAALSAAAGDLREHCAGYFNPVVCETCRAAEVLQSEADRIEQGGPIR